MKKIEMYVPHFRDPDSSSGMFDYTLEAQYSEEAAILTIKSYLAEKQADFDADPENEIEPDDFEDFEIITAELQVPDDFVIPTGV